jgi:hypothetical protein
METQAVFINLSFDSPAAKAYLDAMMKLVLEPFDNKGSTIEHTWRANYENAARRGVDVSEYGGVEGFVAASKANERARHEQQLTTFHREIESRDADKLKSRLWYQNKVSRAYFEAVTGVNLGKTDKSMRPAVDEWASRDVSFKL